MTNLVAFPAARVVRSGSMYSTPATVLQFAARAPATAEIDPGYACGTPPPGSIMEAARGAILEAFPDEDDDNEDDENEPHAYHFGYDDEEEE